MDKNTIKKLGNTKQLISAYDLTINDGPARGKRLILVNNNRLEVCFNADNALDIAWVKYCGENISYLCKNGLNNNEGVFAEKFDGGFLYTCGLDNLSSIDKNAPIHGSLHLRKAQNVRYIVGDESVTVYGEILTTKLAGKNLLMQREYVVSKDTISINDTIINKGFSNVDYVLLYHTNFAYPFLDEGLSIDFDGKTIPANEKAKTNLDNALKITAPIDNGKEELFYHLLKKGHVSLTNNLLKINCAMSFDIEKLPYVLEWKQLASGEYVLGIEPMTTRFDEYVKKVLTPNESENYKIDIKFSKI